MGSTHLSNERMRQFMLNTLELTEEESDHISGWKCSQCAETMRRVVMETPCIDVTTPDPVN